MNAAAGTFQRDLTPIAKSMAMILVNLGIDLGDAAKVERVIRDFHPCDLLGEVDRLVEICPALAHEIRADAAPVS